MRLKEKLKKAGVIALSSVMICQTAFVTNPQPVQAAEKTTISQRILTLYDMTDVTVSGGIKFTATRNNGARYEYLSRMLVRTLINLKEEVADTEYYIDYKELKNGEGFYFYVQTLEEAQAGYSESSKAVIAKNYEKNSKAGKAYLEFLAGKGLGTMKDGALYINNTAQVEITAAGQYKDCNNYTLTLSASLYGNTPSVITEISATDGKIVLDVEKVMQFLAGYLNVSSSSLQTSLLPVALSEVKIDVLGTVYGALADQAKKMKSSLDSMDPASSDYSEVMKEYTIITTILSACDKVMGSTGTTADLAKFVVAKSKDIVSMAGLVIDPVYDKYTTVSGDTYSFAVTENDITSIAVDALKNVTTNADTIANGVQAILANFVEDQSALATSVANTKTSLLKEIDSQIKYMTGQTEETYRDPKEDSILSVKIDSSFTGNAAEKSRDYEVKGSVVTGKKVDLVADPTADVEKYQIDFNFSAKEPNAGYVNVNGPAVGKKIKDSKFIYKVTKQGTTDGKKVGTVSVVGLKKKSLKSCGIASTVKIGGVKYKVTAVGAKAFKGNKKFTKVTIGKNVKTIGANAFANCKKVKSVNIKSTVLTQIGKNAFANSKKLTKVTIKSKKLKKIGKNAFTTKKGKKITFKVPSKKKKAYKKLIKASKPASYVVK